MTAWKHKPGQDPDLMQGTDKVRKYADSVPDLKDIQDPGFTLTAEAKKKLWGTDLVPGYMFAEEAAAYVKTTTRKISLYRRNGLLKAGKLGKNYVYRKEWLDEFMEAWAGYDLSNEEAVKLAIREKEWRMKHAGRAEKKGLA